MYNNTMTQPVREAQKYGLFKDPLGDITLILRNGLVLALLLIPLFFVAYMTLDFPVSKVFMYIGVNIPLELAVIADVLDYILDGFDRNKIMEQSKPAYRTWGKWAVIFLLAMYGFGSAGVIVTLFLIGVALTRFTDKYPLATSMYVAPFLLAYVLRFCGIALAI